MEQKPTEIGLMEKIKSKQITTKQRLGPQQNKIARTWNKNQKRNKIDRNRNKTWNKQEQNRQDLVKQNSDMKENKNKNNKDFVKQNDLD